MSTYNFPNVVHNANPAKLRFNIGNCGGNYKHFNGQYFDVNFQYGKGAFRGSEAAVN